MRLPSGVGLIQVATRVGARNEFAEPRDRAPNITAWLIGLIPGVQLRAVPGTGLRSPETGPENRRYRDPTEGRDRTPLI